MMMAYDSGQPPASRLDDELLGALRLAMRGYLKDAEDPSSIQESLVLVASAARAHAILPEQLLVTLKEAWSSLPEVRAMHDSGEQVRLLQRVVTMCIKEYYSV
jgi:hypothetical protein